MAAPCSSPVWDGRTTGNSDAVEGGQDDDFVGLWVYEPEIDMNRRFEYSPPGLVARLFNSLQWLRVGSFDRVIRAGRLIVSSKNTRRSANADCPSPAEARLCARVLSRCHQTGARFLSGTGRDPQNGSSKSERIHRRASVSAEIQSLLASCVGHLRPGTDLGVRLR